MLRRKKWMVRQKKGDLYAAKAGGWTLLPTRAKRFRKHSDAQYVAVILSMIAMEYCIVVK